MRRVLFLILMFMAPSICYGAMSHIACNEQKASTAAPFDDVYTCIGFTPTLVMTWTSGLTASSGSTDMIFSIGAMDGTTEWHQSAWNEDNAPDGENYRSFNTSDVTNIWNGTSDLWEANFKQFTASGVDWSYSTNESQTRYMNFLALNGDPTFEVGTFNTGTGAVTSTVEVNLTCSCQPDLVIFVGGADDTTGGDASSTAYSIGAATGATERFAIAGAGTQGAATADTARYQTSSQIYVKQSTSAVVQSLDLTSMDADGFTVDITATDSTSRVVGFVAFSGIDAKIGSISAATGTGSQESNVTSWTPDALILASIGDTTSDSVLVHSRISWGAGTGASEEGVVSVTDEDNVARTDATRMLHLDKIYGVPGIGGTTYLSAADLTSLDADGFTLNYSDVGTAYDIFYIAFRETPAAGGARRRVLRT